MTEDETGRPVFFDPNAYLNVVEMYIMADEVEKALWLLDNPPMYYKDHPTERQLEIRESLHRQVFTPCQYKGIYSGTDITPEDTKTHWPLRAQILEQIVTAYNVQDIEPNIMELAPGGMWLVQGLGHKQKKFTYEHKSLDDIKDEYPKADNPKVNIFVAFEILEHLSNEWEIYQNYLKFGKKADVVLLSTPLYTHIGARPDWRDAPLGHLKTYSPSSFHAIAAEMFRGYEWSMSFDDNMVIIGKRGK